MRRAGVLWIMAVTGALALPAAAFGQNPAPAPPAAPAPQPAPAPVPPAAPPAATLKLSLAQVTSGAVLAGERFVVNGTVTPYVPGQQLTVRLYRKGRKVAARTVTIQPAAAGTGRISVGLAVNGPGRILVRASHRGTPQLGTGVARAVGVRVLALHAAPGSRGLVVRMLQAQLARLGYVVGRRGVYDDRTARAVTAFRKVTGMARTNVASRDVFRKLAKGKGAFHVRFPKHGRHVEANIGEQVLALIDHGKAQRIYPMSSGKPSTPTILGTFSVYMKTPGTNAKGMVDSNYFIRGYAIHGYYDVPVYNASHGCLRVPVPDAASIYGWVRVGTIVDTYY